MAKFKCLLSGNVIEFTNQVDIDSMVGHSGYEAVVEQVEAPAKEVVKTTPKKTNTKAATPAQGE
jgi:hypothetical protein